MKIRAQPYRAGTPACIWQGNEYLYGRNYGGELRSRCRVQCDGTEWFQRVSQETSGVGTYTHRSWDYVITLCKEAGEELKFITLDAKQQVHFDFEDPFKNRFQNESEQEKQVASLYETMYRRLYEFYRDELSEQLLPRCTCGANTYCRCE